MDAGKFEGLRKKDKELYGIYRIKHDVRIEDDHVRVTIDTDSLAKGFSIIQGDRSWEMIVVGE